MSTTVVADVANGQWGRWCHPFQGANTRWLSIFEQRIISGNFFLGLQANTFQAFQGMNIPKGAIIESAVMRVTAFQNNFSAYTTQLNTIDRGANIRNLPHIRPGETFQGWRPDQWTNADMVIRNILAGTIDAPAGGAANISWILRQLPPTGSPTTGSAHRDRLGQRFTVGAGSVSDRTLASVLVRLRRSAVAPAGVFRLEVMGVDADGLPDETVLATSDTVAMSTLSTLANGAVVTVNFTGAEQIVLDPGDYYMVINPDQYDANNANWMALRGYNAFLTTGRLQHYGLGIGTDWQNFPGEVEVSQSIVVAKLSTDIPWAVPSFVTGLNYNTPDISQLIQDQVNDPDYGSDRSLIVTTSGNTGSINRIWRSNGHPSNTPPRLTVTWRPRKAYVY